MGVDVEGIPSGPWHLHVPFFYLLLTLVPVTLFALAWRDWRLAAAEGDAIGAMGAVTLAVQSVAALALPALVVLIWARPSVDMHAAMDIVFYGCVVWLITSVSAAVTAGRARRFTLPAGLISLMLWGIWTVGV